MSAYDPLFTARWNATVIRELAHKIPGPLFDHATELLNSLNEYLLATVYAPPAPYSTLATPEQVDEIKPMSDPYPEEFKRSPNQGGSIKPKFIVLHSSYGSFKGGVSWILSSKSQVSYHYLIDDDGSRVQFVNDTAKAWHAGKSQWKGYSGLNSHSVGVAFHGASNRDPSDKGIDSCAWKCIYLMDKFGLSENEVITHKMISPGRKDDCSDRTHGRVIARIKALL